jgi:hypothetical protein
MVTKEESEDAGYRYGYSAGEGAAREMIEQPYSEDNMAYESIDYGKEMHQFLYSMAVENENHARQYSDWGNGIGAEMTNRCEGNWEPYRGDSDRCYYSYDEGVNDGIKAGIRDYMQHWVTVKLHTSPTKWRS